MSEDLNQGAPSVEPTTAPEPAAPSARESLSDITSRALEVAYSRQADREAGKEVPDELPSVAADRARDEHGKFAPKPKPSEKEPAKAEAPKTAPKEAAETPQTPTQEAAPAPAGLQPNPRWTDDHKAAFTRLPPEAQKSVLEMAQRQDADYTRKTQELAEQRKHVEPFVGALQEHGQFLQSMSTEIRQPPARIVGDVLQAYQTLVRGAPHERAQTLAFMANVARIDLRALAAGQADAPQQERVPEPIMRELTQLRQQLGDLDQFRQATVQEREQQSLQTAQQQIESFRSAKSDDGQPKHPHFDAVAGHVVSLLEAGHDLDAAYGIASKPITDAVASREAQDRAAQQAREAQARDAAEAADKERAAKVARAQRAGSPRPKGTSPGMTQSANVSDNAWEAMRKYGLA